MTESGPHHEVAAGRSPASRLPAATAPREQVAARSPWRLFRYSQGAPQGPPVLVVYSLINRPTLLDLDPERSLIRRLIEQGRDVYLLAWDEPAHWQRFLGLDDYALRFAGQALDALCRHRGVEATDVIGICQGGVLALCHAIVFPARVRRLVLMATPVDTWRGDHRLGRVARASGPVSLERNIPGSALSSTFVGLRLTDLLVRRYRPSGNDDQDEPARQRFMRMDAWMYDCPDQPARLLGETIEWLYQENRLARGQLELDGHRVSLSALAAPVLNIAARKDHLVPHESALALREWLPRGQVTSRLEPGGHLGLFVSRRAQETLAPAIGHWLDDGRQA